MNFATRTNHNSRPGVTLLFTISMIVLFLLMGTTFVVVANDYYKTAVRRSRLNTYKVDVSSLMDRAFYEAFRGPSLNDNSSPLRGHDLLSDVYGYGFRGTLSGPGFIDTPGPGLVVLNVVDFATQLLREESGPIISDPAYVDGLYNGRLITFTSGEATGYSTRIISQANVGGTLQFVIPRDSAGIDWSMVTAGTEYVVNGREYSGFGAGAWTAATYTYDPDAAATEWLDVNCLNPICTGEHRDDLTSDMGTTGYLRSSQSPNEPYDAPDYQNMLLAGLDGTGNTIPSGHRDRLYQDLAPGTNAYAARTLTMRPLYLATSTTDATPRDGSTANADFPNNFVNKDTGVLANAVNSEDGLDVDNDNDGTKDSVWIDIGLPIQTDNQGRRFRPLVAYHIIDLDGRLNLNAHGSHGDVATGSLNRYGLGMGPSDISLSVVAGTDYESLLDDRYGAGENSPGNTNNSLTAGQKLFGTPTAPQYLGGLYGTALPFLSEGALTFPPNSLGTADDFPSYFLTPTDLTTDVKLTASPYASDFSAGGGVGDSHFQATELESIYRGNDIDGSLMGGRLYDDFPTVRSNASSVTTDSFEVAVPASPRSIVELLRERVRDAVGDAAMNDVVREFMLGTIDPANKYISNEMLLGGRFDLNRPLGDGLDNDGDGVIDDAQELGATAQGTSGYTAPEQRQYQSPPFDLDNQGDGRAGDQQAKVIMARQLYIMALLVAGEDTTGLPSAYPAVPAAPGPGMTADLSYRKAVAQWAVNVVDYRDPDSIMTVFEYDINPFNDPRVAGNVVDGNPSTTSETDRGIVIGLERPEILMTETFAAHDRQLLDTNTDPSGERTVANGGSDPDWDSPRLPNTTAFIELYHPWRQSYGSADSFQALPRELTNDPSIAPDGVHLNKLAPDDTPVWRIVVHRGENATMPSEAVRSIYFADPSSSVAPTIGDAFYPGGAVSTIAPGEYAVIGSPGNVAGRNMTTFGRLTTMAGDAPTAAEINNTRSIELTNTGVVVRGPEPATRSCKTIIIDRSVPTGGNVRGLSLSDPNGGYTITAGLDVETDGTLLTDGGFPPMEQARDTPYDASLGSTPYHDVDDVDAVWTNGVMKQQRSGGLSADYQFRVLRLQRLADPNSAFDIDSNPYVTVDIASVDLLAYNGLTNNPDNGNSAENGFASATSELIPFNGDTQMGGIERGEKIAGDVDRATARRTLFRFADDRKEFNADVAPSTGDDHTLSYSFLDNVTDPANPERLETLGGRNDAYDDDTVPFGWLAWNNRPYANHMELAQVPMLSAEGLVRHFGESEADASPPSIGTEETSDKAFAYFFGDDQFGHLLGFGGVVRGAGGAIEPNRFDILLDFVEVPNRFLGSETFLPADVAASGPLLMNLNAPFRSIPNFRYPGKVNINTIYSADVWDAVRRGFGPTATLDFNSFRTNRSFADGPTDIGRVYTTAQGSEFVETGASPMDRLRKGQAGAMFRTGGTGKFLDSENDTTIQGGTDIESAATFRNEVRTRLGGLTTTRSSVYAFWITIGYFEVDEFGRVGAELGANEGEVSRNRAFYMVDRSIPVASEPGKNHNVDQAVLVRTIIE